MSTPTQGTSPRHLPAFTATFFTLFILSTGTALAAEAPKVEEQWVTNVSATGATLQAKVNPDEVATTYKFEYATSEAALLAGHGELFPAPPTPEGSAGAGSEGVLVEAHPQGLQPHTNYWYRVVAKNGEGSTPGCQTQGSCRSFTTQPAGGEGELLDRRRWELVSPPTKDGALILPIPEGGGRIQAASNGSAIAYLSNGFAKSGQVPPAGNANDTQLLSMRGPGNGWSSQDISSPHSVSTGISVGQGQEYRFFSSDLSMALVEPFAGGRHGEGPEGAVPLSEGASEKTIYLRADAPLIPDPLEQGGYDEAMTEGGFKALVTSKLGYANIAQNVQFGGKIYFVGASNDLSHVVIASANIASLVGEGEEEKQKKQRLYEWTAGGLQVVSVLPNGEEASGALLGYGTATGEPTGDIDASGAVSSDGSRVFWSYKGHLFMRDVTNQTTVQLDLPGPGIGGEKEQARFEFASSDGSKVFFTDGEPGKADLYVCEMVEDSPGAPACNLSDLTTNGSGGAGVLGVVVPASDEDSYAYFFANGVLTEEPNAEQEVATPGDCGGNIPGTCNLYVRHYNEASKEWEAPMFIASVSSEDRPDWSGNLDKTPTRVSPNGEYVAFMSERSLTHYDNIDVSGGQPDEEVYLYKAPTADAPSGRLVCVSCNPTGERPSGVFDPTTAENPKGLLIDTQRIWNSAGRWLAGVVPGWTGMALRSARYQSRYLSDSGRMFFESSDSLVPQATNGLMDVFEYEPEGVGDCASSSSNFSETTQGCLGLISSGSSGEESAFLDASENGEDAFLLTSARLVSGDQDTAFDVYDAHLCSDAVPCPPEIVSSPPCETADSCRDAPLLQSPVFEAPASATFSGPGNLTPPTPVPPAKPKTLTKAQLLAKALKACRKKHSTHKRLACEKQAHKRYPSKSSKGRK